jgi:hypothetical protein
MLLGEFDFGMVHIVMCSVLGTGSGLDSLTLTTRDYK